MPKKKINKPLRAVATTSVASKKQVEDARAAREAAEVERARQIAEEEAAASRDRQHDTVELGIGQLKSEAADWEDEEAVEQNILQSLVDRLHDKGEKEVSRVLKSIEYEKRLSGSLPSLDIPEMLRDDILRTAASEERQEDLARSDQPSSAKDEDKAFLKLYICYMVLSRLGFSEARIVECLTEAIGIKNGWENALEWMWFHLSEDEWPAPGEHAPPPDQSLEMVVDPPLLPEPVDVSETPSAHTQSERAPSSSRAIHSSTPISFKQLDAISSDSDSEGDLDLDRLHENWARKMLALEELRFNRPGERKKGVRKHQTPKPVIETPDMRTLKDAIVGLEREYLFDRKQADAILKALRTRLRADALEARLREKEDGSQKDSASNRIALEQKTPGTAPVQCKAELSNSDNDDEDLFGGMLDDPEPDFVKVESGSSVVPMRAMTIPKSFSFSGNTPKGLLHHGLNKSGQLASTSYVKLSGHSRAVRVGLEILWTNGRRRVWRMDDIACSDVVEAENYVSTLALNELSGQRAIPSANWRTMPPDCRQLWEELEQARNERDKAVKRGIWAKIRGLFSRQGVTENDSVPSLLSRPSVDPGVESDSPVPTTVAPVFIDSQIQADFDRRQSTQAYQVMLAKRRALPISSFRQQILDTITQSQILVLSGETGCGKSTQLPAYILEDQLSKGLPCKIYVTEPRRISAISLAQRVSQELGERPGSVGMSDSLVGYSIRLEAKVSASTRLAFVTNGIALRMLEAGSGGRRTAFDEITHIVVDEVHERSIESDFLLIVLKQLVQQRPDLKVILMSATLDAEKISAFFGGCPALSVPGRTFPVQVNYLEDAVELTRYRIDETSPYAVRSRFVKAGGKQLEWDENGAKSNASESDDDDSHDPARLSSTRYSVDTVKTVNLLDSRQIPYDLIVRLLETICIESPDYYPFSAAVLIFMPGLAEIRKLNELLQAHGCFGSEDFMIFPLHSSISSEGQGAIFDIPPHGIRKIVISTNIAETGVTIPDVTCVIDCGKHREMRYDEKRQISRLVEAYVARDNAKQRRGRAGRVQEGLAFHLFTKARHDTQMALHAVPEMLRLSLQDLALRIKVLKVKLGSSIEEVLSKALDPPSPLNIQRAVSSLIEVKALTPNEEITAMGRLLSKLPMDVHLGKFLLIAAFLRCLDPALTIAATLNSKSPFITPFGFEAQADSAKRAFAIGNSDFLTLANVFASWRRASENPNYVRTFCKKNYLSHQNLQQIEELRQQLLSYLIDSSVVVATSEQQHEIRQARARQTRGFRTRFAAVPEQYNMNAHNPHILNAALAAGLYPKLLTLHANGLQTISNQQPISMHPSSVNFKISKTDFGTNYLMYFTIMQSKKLYAWETGPVHDRAVALLCGDSPDFKIPAYTLNLDRSIRYQVHPRTAIAIKILRQRFNAVMTALMRGKKPDQTGARWFEFAIRFLS